MRGEILVITLIAVGLLSSAVIASINVYVIRIDDFGGTPWFEWIAHEELEEATRQHFLTCFLHPEMFGLEPKHAYGAKIKIVYIGKLHTGENINPRRVIKYKVIFDDVWEKAHAEISTELYACDNIYVDKNETLVFDFSKAVCRNVSSYKEIVKTVNITNPIPIDVRLFLAYDYLPDVLDNRFFDIYVGVGNNSRFVWKPLKVDRTYFGNLEIPIKGGETTLLAIKMVMHDSQNIFPDNRSYPIYFDLLSLARWKIGDYNPYVIRMRTKVLI